MNDRLNIAFKVLKKIKDKKKQLGKNSLYDKIEGYKASADLRLDDVIVSKFKKNFPDDNIISEESRNKKEGKYTWVIDPLCGTTNFLHSLPLYSHSISLLKNNKIIFSIIYDSIHDEIFFSDTKKSFLNKQKIKVSKTKLLKDCLVCINANQSDFKGIKKNFVKLFTLFAPPTTRRIHILESANMELAYVACGRIDAYINFDDKIWDITAGSALIKAAGGKVNYFNKKKYFLGSKGIIASNGLIHKKILEILKKNDYF